MLDQHKWQLLSILPDIFFDAENKVFDVGSNERTSSRIVYAPYDFTSPEECKRAAHALLLALKNECLNALSKDDAIVEALVERLRSILPPIQANVAADSELELSLVEVDICRTFRELSQELVKEAIVSRRSRHKRDEEAKTAR